MVSKPLAAPKNGPLALDDYEGVWIHMADWDALIGRVVLLLPARASQAAVEDMSAIGVPVSTRLSDRAAVLVAADGLAPLDGAGE